MIFTDIPVPIAREVYAEALELYARNVRKRASAVYQVGAIGFPGVSDLDILVTVKSNRLDNSQFFSAIDCLPGRYRKLFLHEPFILPESCIEVIRYTSHGARVLVTGSDKLAAIQPLSTQTERWCKLLESYRNFEVFLEQCKKRGTTSARLSVAVASSMRYVLRDLDSILGSDHSIVYSGEIDALRADLLSSDGDSLQAVKAIWELFNAKVVWLQTTLNGMLPLAPGETIWSFAKEFLNGDRQIGELGGADIVSRKAAIEAYFKQLCQQKFSYGYLFFLAVYGDRVKRYRQAPLQRLFLSLPYRLARLASR